MPDKFKELSFSLWPVWPQILPLCGASCVFIQILFPEVIVRGFLQHE